MTEAVPSAEPTLSTTAPGPLPAGTRLVHIGPSKTGTTSLQGSLWVARATLRAQGVRYVGVTRHSALAARAAAGIRDFHAEDDTPPPDWHWQGLLREIRRAGDNRVVVSSEYLAHAAEPAVRRIVRDVGPDRIHVLVTLRPIAHLLSSLWQQRVQAGSHHRLEAWLEATLGRDGALPETGLWHYHHHDRLVARWADEVGPDRVTVLILDPANREWLLRQVEALLAVDPGTLALQDDYLNRSLTLPEAEALVALNRRLRKVELGRPDLLYVTHAGAARFLKTRRPPADEPRAGLPGWAADRAAIVASEIVEGLRESGVRILGDLEALTAQPAVLAEDGPGDRRVPLDIAATMAMGVARAGGMLRRAKRLERHARLEEGTELGYLGMGDLVRLMVTRAWRRGRRAVRTWLALGG